MSSEAGDGHFCIGCGAKLETRLAGDQCIRCLLALGAVGFPADPYGASDHSSELEAISCFGDYELIEEISRGGMGVVYRARQMSLNRQVAVKIMAAGKIANLEAIQRFKAEGLAAAKLDHPGIVPVYEVGEIDTQHYLVMRLIDGGSLADRISDNKLALGLDVANSTARQRKIADLIRRVSIAVTHAHEHGVLHRDIKPANILIDRNGDPLLTDFGLAKSTDIDGGGLTLAMTVLGSPNYMAPEQATGRPGDITTLVDVYGIGATLYTLLAGRPPFQESNVVATIHAVIEQPPPRLRQINPAIHRDLETIVMKCLEKSPKDRYRSALEIADELQRFLDDKPVISRPVGMVEWSWRWCKRNPIESFLVSTIVLVSLLGLVTIVWQWQRSKATNERLKASLDRNDWGELVEMTSRDENSEALAHLAQRLRETPNDWRAIMLAMSILDNRRFPQPKCEPLTHGAEFEIKYATFNHQGNQIATASIDATARIWDATSGKELLRLPHSDTVSQAKFSLDDTLIATASIDSKAKVWDSENGTLLCELKHPGPVNFIDFLGSTNIIATAAQDGRVRIWDTRMAAVQDDVQAIASFDLQASAAGLAFAPSVSRLVVGNAAGRIVVFSINKSNQLIVEKEYKLDGKLSWVGLSFDGRYVAASGSSVECWDTISGESVFIGASQPSFDPKFANRSNILHAHTARRVSNIIDLESRRQLAESIRPKYQFFSSDFSADDRLLAIGGWDYAINILSIKTGIKAFSDIRTFAAVQRLQFNSESNLLLAVEGSTQWVTGTPPRAASVSVWQMGKESLRRTHPPQGAQRIGWLALSNDSRMIAFGNEPFDSVTLLDSDMNRIASIPLSLEGFESGLAFTPDGKFILVGNRKGSVCCIDVALRKVAWGPVDFGFNGDCYRISHDGRLWVHGGIDGVIRMLSVETGEILKQTLEHGGTLNDLNFSPDDRLLASASDDHSAKIWDIQTGTLLQTVKHDFRIDACKFSPDGKRVVTASSDFTARVWDVATGEPIGKPMKHQGEVSNASFSSDGNIVLTGARDATAGLWDANTGEAKAPFMIHTSALREANLSPDGRLAITVDHDALQVWDVASGQPVSVRIRQSSSSGVGYDSSGGRVPFAADGSFAIWGHTAPIAIKVDTAIPTEPAPSWFPDMLERIGRQRLLGNRAIETIPMNESIFESYQEIDWDVGKDDYYLRRFVELTSTTR